VTIAATYDLEIRQADFGGAYLNGKLDVELYMTYPEGMTPKPGCNALRPVGSLYGLKQSGRTRWIELGMDWRRWVSIALSRTGACITGRVRRTVGR
jgi:hypothetical protein